MRSEGHMDYERKENPGRVAYSCAKWKKFKNIKIYIYSTPQNSIPSPELEQALRDLDRCPVHLAGSVLTSILDEKRLIQ